MVENSHKEDSTGQEFLTRLYNCPKCKKTHTIKLQKDLFKEKSSFPFSYAYLHSSEGNLKDLLTILYLDKQLQVRGVDVIEIQEGHSVYADVPKHFVYANKKGCYDLTHERVIVGGELSYLAGKYIVTKTCMEGGGPSYDGGYPDGHHVYCVSADNEDRKIDFYQSGSFTAMIKDIKPIGKAKLQWVFYQTS